MERLNLNENQEGLSAGSRIRHRGKPAEPFAVVGSYGLVLRVTPAAKGIPAQALVDWDGFCTWERLSDLKGLGD